MNLMNPQMFLNTAPLDMHRQPSSQRCSCVSNVVVRCVMMVWALKFINNIALYYFVGTIGWTIFHDKVMSSQIVIIYIEFQIRISFYRLHFTMRAGWPNGLRSCIRR